MISVIVGCLLIILGAVAIMAGVAIAVASVLANRRAGFAPTELKALEAIKGILDGFAKLDTVGRLVFTGLVCVGLGTWLLVAQPAS